MQVLASQTPPHILSSSGKKAPFYFVNIDHSTLLSRRISSSFSCSPRNGEILKLAVDRRNLKARALNIGTGNYEDEQRDDGLSSSLEAQHSQSSSKSEPSPSRMPYYIPAAIVLCACILSLVAFIMTKGPSSILQAIAKSGFTAAFSLIFVSEIGDKTFFIAMLLAMQYEKVLVLLGSMAALSLMSVLSVIIGLIFHSVPAQFQTTLPIGEYTAVALLLFFGIKSIKDAWNAPPAVAKNGGEHRTEESDEFVEAQELVKEKEWGDRSMLATIALGAAQSPWGVATGAITGHLIATTIAIIGGAFLANYISEKLVGYVGGVLFLVFATATFFGVF